MNDITIFGTASCGQCKIAKKLLGDKGITYDYVDLSTLSESASSEIIEEALEEGGFHSMPIAYHKELKKFIDWRELLNA